LREGYAPQQNYGDARPGSHAAVYSPVPRPQC
jgi:hypothetical protein